MYDLVVTKDAKCKFYARKFSNMGKIKSKM